MGDSEKQQNPRPWSPSHWHVALVQDCNLRCAYCATGFGTYGKSPRVADREVRERLVETIYELAGPDDEISIELGGGEPFLRFDLMIDFVDCLRSSPKRMKRKLNLSATTNGTLLDSKSMLACKERRIGIGFSIDGPESGHDANRTTRDGRRTHAKAMANWRQYREMVKGTDVECDIHSVISGDSRLIDVARFWRDEGIGVFQDAVQEPSRYVKGDSQDSWSLRRAQYLEDFRTIAISEAERLGPDNFKKEYRGPWSLFIMWDHLAKAIPYSFCGAGDCIAAVDASGNLYPCEGFVGHENHVLGDLWTGVDPEKHRQYRDRTLEVLKDCDSCWARFVCVGGCFAGNPAKGVVLNMEKGCDFAKSLAEIAIESFRLISNKK